MKIKMKLGKISPKLKQCHMGKQAKMNNQPMTKHNNQWALDNSTKKTVPTEIHAREVHYQPDKVKN